MGKNLYSVYKKTGLWLCIVFLACTSFFARSQVIITIAGNGVSGYGGDGGAATAASINTPTSITIDASGNLFISDQLNSCVRRVTPGGIISTYAGTTIAGYGGDGLPANAA